MTARGGEVDRRPAAVSARLRRRQKAGQACVARKLADVDPDELSPRDALSVLYELRKLGEGIMVPGSVMPALVAGIHAGMRE